MPDQEFSEEIRRQFIVKRSSIRTKSRKQQGGKRVGGNEYAAFIVAASQRDRVHLKHSIGERRLFRPISEFHSCRTNYHGSPSSRVGRSQSGDRRLSTRRQRSRQHQGKGRRPRADSGLRRRRDSPPRAWAWRNFHRPTSHSRDWSRANLPHPLACRPKREDHAARQGSTRALVLSQRTIRT